MIELIVVGLVFGGLFLWNRSANAAAAKIAHQLPAGIPASPTAPSGAGYLTVVPSSDTQAIYLAMSNLAALTTNGIVQASFTSGDVEADTIAPDHGLSSPVFVTALAAAQKAMNALGDFSKAGLPFSSVRTDGVLDYATTAALNAAAMEITEPPPRVAQNVAPFGSVGAPLATYNVDSASLTPQAMRIGETLTITVPASGGYTLSINDTISDADQSNSAVYPFGSASPGLPSQALGPVPTQTWGFLAVRPGSTKLTLTPAGGGQALSCLVTVS